MTKTEVTHASTDHDEAGLVMTLRIRRLPTHTIVIDKPRADDYPTDLRDALATWLLADEPDYARYAKVILKTGGAVEIGGVRITRLSDAPSDDLTPAEYAELERRIANDDGTGRVTLEEFIAELDNDTGDES